MHLIYLGTKCVSDVSQVFSRVVGVLTRCIIFSLHIFAPLFTDRIHSLFKRKGCGSDETFYFVQTKKPKKPNRRNQNKRELRWHAKFYTLCRYTKRIFTPIGQYSKKVSNHMRGTSRAIFVLHSLREEHSRLFHRILGPKNWEAKKLLEYYQNLANIFKRKSSAKKSSNCWGEGFVIFARFFDGWTGRSHTTVVRDSRSAFELVAGCSRFDGLLVGGSSVCWVLRLGRAIVPKGGERR